MKLLNTKLTCLTVLSHLTDSGQVVIHAVTQCVYACQHQQSWGFRTWPRWWTTKTVYNGKLDDGL